MNFTELIGFLITMVILGFLFFRQVWEQRQRAKYPEKYEQIDREREEALQEFLDTLEGEEKKKHQEVLEEPPPQIELPKLRPEPQPEPRLKELTPDTRFDFETKLEEYDSKTLIEGLKLQTKIGGGYAESLGAGYKQRVFDTQLGTGDVGGEYAIHAGGYRSEAKRLVQQSRALKNQIIVRDILGPPKGLQ